MGELSDFMCVLNNLISFLVIDVYVALSDPGFMKFQQRLGPFQMDWRTTMHANGLLTIFQEFLYLYYSWKIIRTPFACMVILQSKWPGP